MTEQEKHELARQLKDNIEDLVAYLAAHPDSMDACDVRWRIRIGSIALSALTAPPVKLPDAASAKYYTDEGYFMAFDYKRDLKATIRAAGYEVEE